MSTRDSVAVDARIAAMASAATDLLAELEPDARSAMQYRFDDEAERRSWFYAPTRHGGSPSATWTPRRSGWRSNCWPAD